jgi:hypothetical protein
MSPSGGFGTAPSLTQGQVEMTSMHQHLSVDEYTSRRSSCIAADWYIADEDNWEKGWWDYGNASHIRRFREGRSH